MKTTQTHSLAPLPLLLLLLSLLLTASCSDESTPPGAGDMDTTPPAADMNDAGGGEPDQALPCPEGKRYDSATMRCQWIADMAPMPPGDMGDMGDGGSPGDMGRDGGGGDMTMEDVGSPDMPMVDPCDRDGDQDRAATQTCGGMDCDDDDPRRASMYLETCDEVDNDCDQELNEELDCTFVAHTREHLYKVDPFKKQATIVAPMPMEGGAIQDIDTHPDGRLFGITRQELRRYDGSTNPPTWKVVGAGLDSGNGQAPSDPNGMAIDQLGQAYVTSGDALYRVDLQTGIAQVIGLTGNFYSSGDAVINKQNTLFMTSKRQDMDDQLVEVNRTNASGTLVGDIPGFDRIFGLTFAWGRLFGLTSQGELLEISRATGQSRMVHTFLDDTGQPLSWYGAASTPSRD